jgi:hypothetical protein
MLFRSPNSELVEIKRMDFTTDKLYYEQIMMVKYHKTFPKINSMKDEIVKLIK